MVMKMINIQEAKTHLSRYIRQIKEGESFYLCERNIPIAEIRPLHPPKHPKTRKLGTMRRAIRFLSDRFDQPLTQQQLSEFVDKPV